MDKTAEVNKASSNTKRIAKNTLMLYFRQILIMLVSLYTVRVVLNVLGTEDYGIYNVVAGVVTMFSFLSGAMATASQRYFSFDLGKGDNEHLKTTFSVTFQIYVLLALVVVLLVETLGLWFVNHKLVIPAERMVAANWIFQAAIVSFLLTLITTPYMASIIAHENMNVYAYVSIIEAGLKLGIVFLLKILLYDKLIVYGLLLATVALINTSIYRLYCHKHYEECKFRFVKDGKLFKEIVSYSGWNLFGSFASVVKLQGISWVINIFYGPIVNAANAIAVQVRSVLNTFANNFSLAVRPQIIKNYANNQYDEMHKFVCFSCKITFFLSLFIVSCLIVNIEYILSLWLKQVPDYTVMFVRLLFIEMLIESISLPMASANQATGKIALYQCLLGAVIILNIPFSIIITKLGFDAQYIYIGSIVFVFCTVIIRFIFLNKIQTFSLLKYIKDLIIPILVPTFVIFVFQYFVRIPVNSLLVYVVDLLFKALVSIVIIFLLGFSLTEKKSIMNMIKSKILRRK